MSCYDYADPGTDPAYCDGLRADDVPEEEDMTALRLEVGTVLQSTRIRKCYRIERVGHEQVEMNGVWYRNSQVRQWIEHGVLTIVSEEKSDAENQ